MLAIMPSFRNSVFITGTLCSLIPTRNRSKVNRIHFLHLTICIDGLYYASVRFRSHIVTLCAYGNRLVLTVRNKCGEIDLLL